MTLRWLGDEGAGDAGSAVSAGRRFEVDREGRRIPGVAWLPDGPGPHPLVLAQHGGSGHKQDANMLELAVALNSRGMAVAAIDGLLHGERRVQPIEKSELLHAFLQFWQQGGGVSELVGDWLHVIDALSIHPAIDGDRLGWYGLSMGTAYGVTVAARTPRMQAVVLGKWSGRHVASAHMVDDARDIRSATLFIQHWDDELFDRDGTLGLFTALGTQDKRLVAYPGGHFGRSAEELGLCVDFLASRLGV